MVLVKTAFLSDRLSLTEVVRVLQRQVLLLLLLKAITVALMCFRGAVPSAINGPENINNRHSPDDVGDKSLNDRVEIVYES